MHHDLILMRWINRGWACGFLDHLMPVFHAFWPFLLILVPLAAWIAVRNRPLTRREVLVLVVLIAAANIVASDVIKPLVDRDRPCKVAADLRVLTPAGKCPSSRSFPSAHAANMFAAACYLSWRRRRSAWFMYPLAALVALSRPYIGVHWPSDIAAGALLGVAMGAVAALVHEAAWPSPWPGPAIETRVGRPLLGPSA